MLTQKESTLMKDLKTMEQVCAETYRRHAQAAKDPVLKGLFENQAKTEDYHFQLLTQIEQGTVPAVDLAKPMEPTAFAATYGACDAPGKANDAYLCNNLLAAEKQASSLYDTCVFEFNDQATRDVFAFIQRAEQFHGKQIYDYLSANAMV